MGKKKRATNARRSGLVIGRLSMTRRGYGFVEASEGDIYVAGRDMAGAMHGDTVGVRVDPKRSRAGRSGSVAKVIERANETIVGIFERHGAIGIVVPTDRRIRAEVFIAPGAFNGAEHGDVVVARLTAYPSRHQSAQGLVEEIIGAHDDPDIEIEVIIREHGLRTEFPEKVATQAENLKIDIAVALEQPERDDIRDWFTVTIDPADARDFDDAITLERVDGRVRLGVHIADVSHYVPWDSAVDEEARKRATSVYLVDRVLPMLPERLSNEICSLNPDEDRLSFSVVMDMAQDGAVESYRIFPSVMRSDRRFDYEQVQSYLDGTDPFPDEDSERLLTEYARIAEAISKRRIARGGLDFETVEAKVRLDDDGKPIDVVVRQRTQATSMIEEAMILANEVVAGHMARAKAPMVYRIHEDPDPHALDQIAVVLKEFDYPVKDIQGASPATFQKIIRFAHDRPEKLLINSLVLRAMERARYVDFLGGHFGLASEAYTHFTSPIRRYPDLIVHRLLKAQLAGNLEKDADVVAMVAELEWLAEHSSIMEREAESAEKDSVRFKLCELMADHVGEEFDGIITGVASYGMFVQLENTAEGLVHVEAMADDYYTYDAERFMLVGQDTGRVYRLGERIRVRIVSVSLGDTRIDMELS